MRVLVVAATGFLGGHIAEAFVKRGDDVVALVRSRARGERDTRLRGARLLEGTLARLPDAVLAEPHDVVVYAAGVWRRDERASPGEVAERCDEVYVRGVETLAERARAWNAHFVFMSGISRYGDAAWDRPLREDATPGKLSIYGAHKRKSEAILARHGGEGLRWTAVAPPEVYGSHDAGGYVRFVYERVRSRRFVLLGDGENRWPLCNVRNVAGIVLHVAAGDGAGVLHVADARAWSQREIATALARALGQPPWFPRVPVSVAMTAARVNAWLPRLPGAAAPFSPAHVRVRTSTMLLDTSRAAALGFEPQYGLDKGIREAVRWWRQSASA
jgi:nucleoside-diphosphate-sugar epimerase